MVEFINLLLNSLELLLIGFGTLLVFVALECKPNSLKQLWDCLFGDE